MDAQPYKTPPRWWSPKLSPARVRFWRFMRRRIRVKYHRLLKIDIQGLENLKQCMDAGHGIMMRDMKAKRISAALCRWTARIVGTLVAVALLVFAIGEGVDREFAVQVSFWGLVLVGIGNVLGWRFELAGGIMALTSVFLVAISILIVQGLFLPVFYLILGLPGILYLTSAILRRHLKKDELSLRSGYSEHLKPHLQE